jgi:ribosomal protein S18 acetylase RimI-like enzyme
VRTRGEWPGRVHLRRGWALAVARPWNDDTDVSAALRLERGGDVFLVRCATWLTDRGAGEVLSPALPPSQTGVWLRAGFRPRMELEVYERLVSRDEPDPPVEVTTEPSPDLDQLARIDAGAFEPMWRVGRLGLADAIGATPHSTVMVVGDRHRPVGFVIAGEAMGVAYLQRLAVDPDFAGRSYGRSLVRAAVRWAGRVGARTMLLNTQPENEVAASLYRSEGFSRSGPPLEVLAWLPPSQEGS